MDIIVIGYLGDANVEVFFSGTRMMIRRREMKMLEEGGEEYVQLIPSQSLSHTNPPTNAVWDEVVKVFP